jgi:glucokinase
LAKENISKDDVQGVGVGVPGPVNKKGEVPFCVNLGWGFVPVEEVLSEMLGGILVKAANDANVAALGEMWLGGAKGYEDVVMVTLGTGVGGGIIIGGKIVSGFHGAGGEFGHLTMFPDETEKCACGRAGCLETYSSATGLVRLARRRLEKTQEETVLRSADCLTAKFVFDAYKDGDKVAGDVVREFADILGDGLSRIACVVDPEIFLIGGGLSKAGQPLIDVLSASLKEKAYGVCKEIDFELAKLGNDAGIYGCIHMIL